MRSLKLSMTPVLNIDHIKINGNVVAFYNGGLEVAKDLDIEKSVPVKSPSGRVFMQMAKSDADKPDRFWFIPAKDKISGCVNGTYKVYPTERTEWVILDTRGITDQFMAICHDDVIHVVDLVNAVDKYQFDFFHFDSWLTYMSSDRASESEKSEEKKEDENPSIEIRASVSGMPRLIFDNRAYRWEATCEGKEAWLPISTEAVATK